MAKTKKSDLKSPNSRRAVAVGVKLHTTYVRDGLYLGYRKTKAKAAWFARKRREGTNQYVFESLGVADDVLPANNVDVLSFDQAKLKAEEWCDQETGADFDNKTKTIADLMTAYLKDRKDHNCKSLLQTTQSIKTHILPTLGDTLLKDFDHHHHYREVHRKLRRWFDNLAESADANDANCERERKRKATANRLWNILRAALNYGYKQEKVKSKKAWDKIGSFPAASKPRIVETTIDELNELVAACNPNFQRLFRAAVYSGCRYSELANLRVRNFYPNTKQIHIEDSKNGHERFIPLNREAVAFFTMMTAHRQGDEFVFVKANGNRWKPTDQQRPMVRARKAAGITKNVTFHQLRHAYASLALQAGMRLEEVGTLLGHLDLKITSKHYARFSGSHLLDKVQRYAPRLRSASPQNAPNDTGRVIPIERLKRRA